MMVSAVRGQSLEVSIEWGDTFWKKEARKASLKLGRSLIEDRIQQIQTQLQDLQLDVDAFFEMLDEEDNDVR
jgi:hypothetical protein